MRADRAYDAGKFTVKRTRDTHRAPPPSTTAGRPNRLPLDAPRSTLDKADMSEAHAESDQLDPEEPSTPLWLTFLGGVLFLLVAIFVLATGGEDEGTEGAAAEQPATPEAAAAGDPEAGLAPAGED